MVKTFIESTPVSLQEAAEVDGAGPLTIFFCIVLPISTPILATVAIWAAVGQWNSFQDTLIYVTDQKLWSLQYLLYTYINQANSLAAAVKSSGSIANVQNLVTRQTPTSIRMTVSVIVVLPILFIYPIFQRYFVKGIMIDADSGYRGGGRVPLYRLLQPEISEEHWLQPHGVAEESREGKRANRRKRGYGAGLSPILEIGFFDICGG